MSTNFYLHHQGSDPLHIGKSNQGRCFMLRVYPELGINTLDDWKPLFEEDRIILDESGTQITIRRMMSIICDRFGSGGHTASGPNGLQRCTIGGQNMCVAHGEGTWDYIDGEFC